MNIYFPQRYIYSPNFPSLILAEISFLLYVKPHNNKQVNMHEHDIEYMETNIATIQCCAEELIYF